MTANKYTTPRDLKSMRTKANIVKAARKLLSSYGYDFMTVQSICKASNVSKGTFYHHFENKDALLSYFTMSAFDAYRKEQAQRLKSLNSLQALFDVYFWYARNFAETGLDFTKSYFAANNITLKSRRMAYLTALEYVDLDDDDMLSISHYTLYLIDRAQKDGFLSEEISAAELFDELDAVAFGVIFEWGNCDASFDIEKRMKKMLSLYIAYYTTSK